MARHANKEYPYPENNPCPDCGWFWPKGKIVPGFPRKPGKEEITIYTSDNNAVLIFAEHNVLSKSTKKELERRLSMGWTPTAKQVYAVLNNPELCNCT